MTLLDISYFFLKKILKSFFKDPQNFFFLISRQIRLFFKRPLYYFKDYMNIISSFISSLLRGLPIKQIIARKINGLWINLDFRLDYRLTAMFLGSYDIEVISVLFRYLKKRTTFIDVGANIGYFSLIGAGFVGKKGKVHSFEPVPIYFNRLLNMSRRNKKYNIMVNNFALGEKSTIEIMNLPIENIGHNSIIPGLLRKDEIMKTIRIQVKRLDEYIFEKNIQEISLIKIDVEGFEYFVLKGLTSFFNQNRPNLPPIITEITPSAYNLMGISLADLEILMESYSYRAYSPDGKKRIDIKKLKILCNILFLQEKN